MSRLKLVQIKTSPEQLTQTEVDDLQACIDFYSSRIDSNKRKEPLNTRLEKVDGGYVVRARNYRTSPSDWVHFYYLHYLRAIGVEWAAQLWQLRNDTMIAALQAEE